MQITFSEDQVKYVEHIFNVAIWPSAGWILRLVYRRLIVALNELITENVNRIREELIEYINKTMKDHEANAFRRLESLGTQLQEHETKSSERQQTLDARNQ